MLSVHILRGDRTIDTDPSPEHLSAALKDRAARFWLDMDRPSEEELSLLDDVFGFHPLAIEDTIGYNQRPKIESYNHLGDVHCEGYFYLVIHGPDLATFRENVRTKELDVFVSERYLVTVHDEPMSSVDNVLHKTKGDPRRALDGGIDMLLHSILDQLVDHYQPILEHLQESIEKLEDDALGNPSQNILTDISRERRELLALRRVIGPQRDVLAQLSRGDVPFIRESTRVYFRDVQDHLARAVEMIELYRELIVSARDLYLSAINNNLNQIMKTLTIITAITAMLNVVTGFYGMNFEELPGIHSLRGFYATVAIMSALTAGSIFMFRKLRWL